MRPSIFLESMMADDNATKMALGVADSEAVTDGGHQ